MAACGGVGGGLIVVELDRDGPTKSSWSRVRPAR
jgi:hypothetical protein